MNNPVTSASSEYHVVEERLYEDLLYTHNDCHSVGLTRAYIKVIPTVKIIATEPIPSKLDKFRKAGLIGCLNDTELTSDNYKNEFYQ